MKMKKLSQCINIVLLCIKHLKLSVVLLALSLSSNLLAEQKYQVGIAVWSGYDTSVQGFKDGMQQAGLIEGKNVTYLQGKK